MPQPKLRDAEDFGAFFSAVALNGAVGTRTKTITLNKRFARLTLVIDYTYSAATSVTWTPYKSIDASAATPKFGQYTSKSISSGVAAVSPYSEVVTGTASFTYETTFDVEGVDTFKLIVAGGGSPGAGDLVTINAVGTLVSQ